MKRKTNTLVPIGVFLGLTILFLPAAILYLLYYGYKLAFYYKDPQASPYDYEDTDQSRACKKVLDEAITEFRTASFEHVSITSDDGFKLSGRYYHVKDNAPLEIQCHGYKGNAITFGILERTDVLNWIKYANQCFGNIPILLSGVSMGAATVLMASAMDLPGNVKGIIADCPYDAPSNIIKKVPGADMGMPVNFVYPLIRLGGMVYGKFNLDAASPVEAVKNAKVPILLIHGDDDRFVPYDMSCNIHAAAPETIEFHTIHGAGHAYNYATAPEEYTKIVHAFTERVFG